MHNPAVPETVEGWAVLHQMFHLDWMGLRSLSSSARDELGRELTQRVQTDGQTAWVHLLGHKADLLLIHLRRDFEGLAAVQLAVDQTRLRTHLEPASSFVSMIELGMYEMTAKIHQQLAAQGLSAGTEPFERAFDAAMETQRERVMSRLFLDIPVRRHVCFYPMNKRRSDGKNWYRVPFARRAAMMREHGAIGREYAGRVTQIISGAIGFDDWEWGVDLFADDPLVFKKLIYEMRFDEASADYGEFGPFYVGLQFSPDGLGQLLDGAIPSLR